MHENKFPVSDFNSLFYTRLILFLFDTFCLLSKCYLCRQKSAELNRLAVSYFDALGSFSFLALRQVRFWSLSIRTASLSRPRPYVVPCQLVCDCVNRRPCKELTGTKRARTGAHSTSPLSLLSFVRPPKCVCVCLCVPAPPTIHNSIHNLLPARVRERCFESFYSTLHTMSVSG